MKIRKPFKIDAGHIPTPYLEPQSLYLGTFVGSESRRIKDGAYRIEVVIARRSFFIYILAGDPTIHNNDCGLVCLHALACCDLVRFIQLG